MERKATSVGAAALALAALWIVVYWWTPAPTQTPAHVSFGSAPSQGDETALDLSDAEPVLVEVPSRSITRLAQQGEVYPPRFIEHTVEPGDSAELISAKYYGTSRHWRSIMHANPKVDFTRIKIGQSLRVPKDPANVQGLTKGDTGSGLAPDPSIPLEYTVRKGDTLSEIAQRIYGRSVLWTVIRDANVDLVGADGRKMKPGQILIIPPAPGTPGTTDESSGP